MGHALAILGHRQDAEDALQEAFLATYRALGSFDDNRRFYPALETVEILASTGGGTVEDRLALEEALGCLSPQSREILMLRHLDGLSYEELAARLELPAGTVMSRLFYSRKELREQLGGKR